MQCTYCKEIIIDQATRCKHCHADLKSASKLRNVGTTVGIVLTTATLFVGLYFPVEDYVAEIRAKRAARRSVLAHFAVGDYFLTLGEHQEAANRYEQALRLDPRNKHAAYKLAEIRLESGRKKFVNLFHRPLDGDELAEVNGLIAEGRFLTELNPDEPRAWALRGMAYFFKREYNSAIESFTEALTRNPDNAGYLAERGFVYCRANRVAEGKSDLQHALNLEPRFAKAWNYLGLCYLKQEKEKARGYFSTAVRYDDRLATAHNNLGIVLRDTHSRIEEFSKAVALDEDFVHAYNNRGVVYLESGEYGKALGDFDEAIRRDPKYVSPLINEALLFLSAKDRKFFKPQVGLQIAQRAVEMSKRTSPAALDALAFAYKRNGDPTRARETCKEVKRLRGGNLLDGDNCKVILRE